MSTSKADGDLAGELQDLERLYLRLVELDRLVVDQVGPDNVLGLCPESDERSVLESALANCAQTDNALASFYLGLLWMERARRHVDSSRSHTQLLVAMACREALGAFEKASAGGIAAASWNLALMFERGYGVDAAPTCAAEFFALAASQHIAAGDLDQDRSALDQLTRIDPEHLLVSTLRLRLFPTPH